MNSRKSAALLSCLLFLGGCSTYTWAPGPSAQGTYEQASGKCRLLASTDQTSFYAQGSTSYVAGAALGAAVGQAVRQQNDFNNCMLASGWVPTGKDDAATQSAQKAEGEAVIADMKACFHAIRTNPKYASLAPHLHDEGTGKFTLAQLADTSFVKPDEVALLSSYSAEQDQCTQSHIDQIARLNPRAADTLQKVDVATREIELSLVQRKISWGEYAQSAQNIQEAAREGRPINQAATQGLVSVDITPPGTH